MVGLVMQAPAMFVLTVSAGGKERAIDTHLAALCTVPFPQPAMPAKDFRQAVGSEAKAGRRMPAALGDETVFSRHRGNSGRKPSAVESPCNAALVRCCSALHPCACLQAEVV